MSRQHRDDAVTGIQTVRWFSLASTAAWSKQMLASSMLVLGIAVSNQMVSAEELSQVQGGTNVGLPAIESLVFESDYTVFMASDVPTEIRQLALRKLWLSPAFNHTDRLDTYTGDYSREGDQQMHRKVGLNLD